MIVVLVVFLLICLFGIKYHHKGNPDFFDQAQTNCIRGVFALIIFMSHFNSYTSEWGGIGDDFYRNLILRIGQMMVAPFLFISGYGIYLSAQKKKNYVKEFPKKRILKTYLFFASAVLLYLIFNLIMHNEYSLKDNILAFTGWKSIGNSNWFMFAILFLYIATYVSALITKKNINRKTIALVFIATIAYIVGMKIKMRGATWWYDTALCFPTGMLLASYRHEITSFFNKHRIASAAIAIGIFASLYVVEQKMSLGALFPLVYNLLSCAFCFLIVRLSFSFSIGNQILAFLGTYGFEIYILQRIPHSVFSSMHLPSKVLFFFLSLGVTLLISIAFKYATEKILTPLSKKSDANTKSLAGKKK